MFTYNMNITDYIISLFFTFELMILIRFYHYHLVGADKITYIFPSYKLCTLFQQFEFLFCDNIYIIWKKWQKVNDNTISNSFKTMDKYFV